MSTRNAYPANATRIQKFSELYEFARAFADEHLGLLILLGDPGLGKSRVLEAAVGNKACWINGTATAFGIYMQAYEFRDRPIVLDDVDSLYRDRRAVRLLKVLCQTDPVKTLTWTSNASALQIRKIPQRFKTHSHVAIIANDWKSLDADVKALDDRAHVLVFNPSPLEIHRQAAKWYGDPEIFAFVGQHLHNIEQHSFRTYVKASELKRAGLNWRNVVLTRAWAGTTLAVARLQADPHFQTTETRVTEFIEAGHGCRATYFKHLQRLAPAEDIPEIELEHATPPADFKIGANRPAEVDKRVDF